MAAALEVAAAEYARGYAETYRRQEEGAFVDVEAALIHIGRILTRTWSPERTAAAAAVRIAFTRRFLSRPRPGTARPLRRLRAAGYRIGLITNCPPEVALVWPATPLATLVDVPVFSCVEGIRKPDPRIYRMTCARLGVPPEACLYVGDGGSRELSGALAVGMRPLLLRPADEVAADREWFGHETWAGETISSLPELLGLVGLSATGPPQRPVSIGRRPRAGRAEHLKTSGWC